MADRIVSYDDWTRGDFGLIDPSKAGKGTFSGKNVVTYDSGLLGPRNGDREFVLGNLTAAPLQGMGWTTRGPLGDVNAGSRVWYSQAGNPFKRFTVLDKDGNSRDPQLLQNVVNYGGVGAPTASDPIPETWQWGTASIPFLPGVSPSVYILDNQTEMASVVAGSPRGVVMIPHKERMYIAGWDGAVGYRVRYSEPANGGSWPALNYFDVGDPSLVRGLATLRGRLIIVKEGSPHGSWYTMSGIPGYNEVLAEQTRGPYPAGSVMSTVGELIWFVPVLPSVIASFDGQRIRIHDQFPVGIGGTGPVLGPAGQYSAAMALQRPGDVLVLSSLVIANDRRMWQRKGQAWFLHTRPFGGAYYANEPAVGIVVYGESVSGGAPRFFRYDPYNNRPPFASDLHATILDPDAAATPVEFTIPTWLAEKNEDVSIRAVTVDYTKWNTGSSLNNMFRVSAQAVSRFNTADGEWRRQDWTEAGLKSSTDGTDSRAHFAFEHEYGGGYRVKIDRMRGVAIRRLHVFLESRPAHGAR